MCKGLLLMGNLKGNHMGGVSGMGKSLEGELCMLVYPESNKNVPGLFV